MDGREHWDALYRTKGAQELSWYQPQAQRSLDLIRRIAPNAGTPILDVGGGASTLVDGLLAARYEAVTVLDLAPTALQIARQRLGREAVRVRWLVGDALDVPLAADTCGVWHDRAVFHFLTTPEQRSRYVAQVRRTVRPGGHVLVASFSLDGPPKCSGLDVVRYGPDSMHAEFGAGFRLLQSESEEHHTPSGKVQSFLYCLCRFAG